MYVVTSAEMRALEQAAVNAGATWAGLMEQAGSGVAQIALRALGAAAGKQVLVLVGPGNNGGDGLVVARHLHDAGAAVTLYLWRRAYTPGDTNWHACRARGVPEYAAAEDADGAALHDLLARADLVIDALLGAGISRPVTGALAAIIAAVNDQHRRVLAVDLPSGIDSDTGAVLGVALQAHITVATGLLKRGIVQYPGRFYAGAIEVVSIGLAPAQLEACMSEMITSDRARELLPRRPADSHKGTFGKVMVVAGSLQYPGAASLATASAARVGAGLVTLAVGRSALGGPGRLPEITLQLLPEADWNALGAGAADEAIKHLSGYQALLVGPGIGREEPTREFLQRLLGLDTPRQRGQIGFRIGSAAEKPAEQRGELPLTVIDADGLTLLSQVDSWWEHVPNGRFILTPHPGEMKRLLSSEELDADHVQVAAAAAKKWGQIVVLKGATTIVADPTGRSMSNDGGNAALATAGTGDILAGAIAGLLAQGLEPYNAAVLGVYLHSAAGRILRDDMGDMGTIASDLLPRLPLAIKALKG